MKKLIFYTYILLIVLGVIGTISFNDITYLVVVITIGLIMVILIGLTNK